MKKSPKIFLAMSLMVLSAAALTGCGGFSEMIGSAVSTASDSADGLSGIDKKSSALAPYVKAKNDFDGKNVTFAYAIDPALQKMKNGEPLTVLMLPGYKDLQQNLTQAKSKSSGFQDIDQSRDAVLEVLNDLAPLAEKMDSYYSTKEYAADQYVKGAEYTGQYLALKEKFDQAYDQFDNLVRQHSEELREQELEALKKANKVKAVAFMEINRDLRTVVDSLDNGDDQKINDQLSSISDKLSKLNVSKEKVSRIEFYKGDMNRCIGAIRTYLGGNRDSRSYNEVIERYNEVITDINHIDTGDLDK